MILTNVTSNDQYVVGHDCNTDVRYMIDKSVSFIYKRSDQQMGKLIHYQSLTWKAHAEFAVIEKLLIGDYIDAKDKLVLDQIMIRFGWVSRDTFQLKWISIAELYEQYMANVQTSTSKNKFQSICRTIGIPMRKLSLIRKERKVKINCHIKELENA